MVKKTKLRNLVPVPSPREVWYEQLHCAMHQSMTGSLSCGVNKFAYIHSSGGGSCVALLPYSSTGKNHTPAQAQRYGQPLIRGTGGTITSVAISPFDPTVVVTGSSTGLVCVWEVPAGPSPAELAAGVDGGCDPAALMTEDITTPTSTCQLPSSLEGQAVEAVAFHPAADGVVAVALARGVAVFDASDKADPQCCWFMEETAIRSAMGGKKGANVCSLAWSADGAALAVALRGLGLALLGPADHEPAAGAGGVSAIGRGTVISCAPRKGGGFHDSVRRAVVVCAGQGKGASCGATGSVTDSLFVTCGFGTASKREVALWSGSELGSGPMARVALGPGTSPLLPIVDPDLSLLCVITKGDAVLRWFHFSGGAKASLSLLGSASVTEGPVLHGAFLPKRHLATAQVEVGRLMCVQAGTDGAITPVSLRIPRKDKAFEAVEELYPPSAADPAGPSLTGAEYAASPAVGRLPVLLNLNPAAGLVHPLPFTSKVLAGGRSTGTRSAAAGAAAGAGAGGAEPVTWADKRDSEVESAAKGGQQADPASASTPAVDAVEERAEQLAVRFSKQNSSLRNVRAEPPTALEAAFDVPVAADSPFAPRAPLACTHGKVALAVRGGGGPVWVLDQDARGKQTLAAEVASAKGTSGLTGEGQIQAVLKDEHTAAVTSLQFQPMPATERSVLVSAAADCRMVLWREAADGGAYDATELCSGLSKPARSLAFHPAATTLLAAGDASGCVSLWDVNASAAVTDGLVGLGSGAQASGSVAWCAGGSLLATGGAGVVTAWDPRAASTPSLRLAKAHRAVGHVQVNGIGDSWSMLTLGRAAGSAFEWCVWDLRALRSDGGSSGPIETAAPVARGAIDTGSAQPFAEVDAELGAALLWSRGTTSATLLDLGAAARFGLAAPGTASTQIATKLSLAGVGGGAPTAGLCLAPKQWLDVAACHVDCVVRVTASTMECTPLVMPRSAEYKAYFQDDLFLPAATGAPSMSLGEWASSQPAADKPQARASLCPVGMQPLSAHRDDVEQALSAKRSASQGLPATGKAAPRRTRAARMRAERAREARLEQQQQSAINQLTSKAATFAAYNATVQTGTGKEMQAGGHGADAEEGEYSDWSNSD